MDLINQLIDLVSNINIQDTIVPYLKDKLETNQFFFTGTVLGTVAMIRKPIASSFLFLWRRGIRKITYSVSIEQNDRMFPYIDKYLSEKYPSTFRNVEIQTRRKNSVDTYIDEDETPIKSNPYETTYMHENDFILIRRGLTYIQISKRKQTLEAARDFMNMHNRTYYLSGIFAKRQITKLLKEIKEYWDKKWEEEYVTNTRIKLFTPGKWGWENKGDIKGKPMSETFFEGKQDVLDDITTFKNDHAYYKKLCIPYKRGYMFYGAPGNGKSTLAHALAKELGMSIYLLDLHTVASDFPKFISSIEPNSVILIEDIDTFFNGRKSVNDNKVNFSTFINALNGISTIENVVTVFTTNHPENLDPALTRDGRCDFKLELKNPTKLLVEEFLTHVFEKPVTLPSYTPNKSFSQVQNIVLRNIANLEKVKQELSGAS